MNNPNYQDEESFKNHFQNHEAPWENRLTGWLEQLMTNIACSKIHEFAGRAELAADCQKVANYNLKIIKDIIKEKV